MPYCASFSAFAESSRRINVMQVLYHTAAFLARLIQKSSLFTAQSGAMLPAKTERVGMLQNVH
jgi:fucose permease